MKLKAIAPLLVAVVLGLFAARMAMKFVANGGPKLVDDSHLIAIAVAGHDIEAGATLAETDITLGKVDAATAPVGAFHAPSEAANRVAKISILKGQPIMPNLLADNGAGFGVGATLPPGMRAITIDINDTTGVAGFILPQCKVDVVTTLQVEGKPLTKTLLEGVTVLAVGSRTNANAPTDPQQQQSKTVTLLVKPKDAERLELASTSRVRLVLRNGRDESAVENSGVTMADLKGDAGSTDPFAATQSPVMTTSDASGPTTRPTQQAQAPGKATWTIEIIKGGQQSTQSFDVTPQMPEPKKHEDATQVNISEQN